MEKFFIAIYLLPFVIPVLGEFNLTVVHISDFHSHWFEYDENKTDCSQRESKEEKCFGGFPRLLTFVREIRKKEKNVLVLSSGEFFLGRSLNALHGWKIARALLPRLDLDAMSLSNHDFDSGIYELSGFLYAMKFPVLCANMWARNTSFLYSRVNKSAVIEVGGKKIGIVGYIHRHAQRKTKNAVSVKFLPEIPSLIKEVRRLESEGIDKIIALGHAGYYTDLQIAKEVKGVDIVIGGDSDIMLFDPGHDAGESEKIGNIHGNYPRIHQHETEVEDDTILANRTLVLHIPQHGMYVGVLRATFDDQGKIIHESGEPVLLDSRIPQDEDTLAFLKYAKGALEDITEHSRLPHRDEVLGKISKHLDGNPRRCRMSECTLGNFLTDAFLHEFTFHYRNKSEHRYNLEQWGPIDAVVFNSGPILNSIEPGFITIQHILKSVSLGGFIKRVYMSGQHLMNMMEHSVRHYDSRGVTPSGAFLQIAGLKVEYDLSQPPGSRVKDLIIRCRDCGDDNHYLPVKQYKTYIIGMPTFLRDGRDGFYDFEEIDTVDFGQFDALLIVEHLRRMFDIEPKLDGRIKFYSPNIKASENETTFLSDTATSESFLVNVLEDIPAAEENKSVSSSISALNESSTSAFDVKNMLSRAENKSALPLISSMNVSSTSFTDVKNQSTVPGNKSVSSIPFGNELSATTVEVKNLSVDVGNQSVLRTSTTEFGVSDDLRYQSTERGDAYHNNEPISMPETSVNHKKNSSYREMTSTELFSNEIIQKASQHKTSKSERLDFGELEEKKSNEKDYRNQNDTESSSRLNQYLTPEAKDKSISSTFQAVGESRKENISKTSNTFKVFLNSSTENNLPSLKNIQKVTPNLLMDQNLSHSYSGPIRNQIAKRSLNGEESSLNGGGNETINSPETIFENKFVSSIKSVVHKTFKGMFSPSDLPLEGSTTLSSLNATPEADLRGVTNNEMKKPTVTVHAVDKTSDITPRTVTDEMVKWLSSVSPTLLQKQASFLNGVMNETRSFLKNILPKFNLYSFINTNLNASLSDGALE